MGDYRTTVSGQLTGDAIQFDAIVSWDDNFSRRVIAEANQLKAVGK